MSYSSQAPIPASTDINTGLSFCHSATLEGILGSPRSNLTSECQSVSNERLRALISTTSVGPFVCTGLNPALDSLKRIFRAVHADKPDLYALVGTAGMLCARLIRGSLHTPSNHSWGTAIDLKIDGELVPLGADYTLQGLLDLYHYFHAEGWYWGAGFTRRDSMHLEVADETVRGWHSKGVI